MSDDDKLDFFLRHWKQIVEWSKLRRHAAEMLDRALLQTLDGLALVKGMEHLDVQTGGVRYGRLHLTRKSHDAWLEFQWQQAKLFDGGWPQLVVVWNKDSSTPQVRGAVKQATAERCTALGMSKPGAPHAWWVWSKELAVTDEPFDLDEYARDCVDQFRHAWQELHGALDTAVSSVLGPDKSST